MTGDASLALTTISETQPITRLLSNMFNFIQNVEDMYNLLKGKYGLKESPKQWHTNTSAVQSAPCKTGQDLLQLLPVVGTLSLLAYVTYQAFKPKPAPKDTKVNLRIQKESSKVVNMVDIEELGDKVSYCRCWRSKKFPICDGSHNKHNEETGDNVGPLVLKRKEPLSMPK
ncbi:CID2B-like protein [Mya arenaria]|uniref:CDGSH iron-sulfur domain-containing protein 2 homologue n=1 Tax=Mya arenaria TaxID=6604 RepID=A0ABY7DH10_MYAAR|nr:CID2B-like protein [Mya arenaria]